MERFTNLCVDLHRPIANLLCKVPMLFQLLLNFEPLYLSRRRAYGDRSKTTRVRR